MPAVPVLRVTELTRRFGDTAVVDEVDLTVERGEIMGFLGPNGAGKTTLMNMVMGLVQPDHGQIELLGKPGGARHKDVRLRVGYLQEKPRIYPEMTAREYLLFFARLYGVPSAADRVSVTLERVGLLQECERRLHEFSRGMQQRACLARVMLHQPEFLILDEPTLGLDPAGLAEMRETLRSMQSAGTTLFFSSHHLTEMERLCDRVAFMKNGKLVAVGRPEDLLPSHSVAGSLQVETFEPISPVLEAIRSLTTVAEARQLGPNRAEVLLAAHGLDAREARACLARELTGLGLTVLSLSAAAPSLEDLFLMLAPSSSAKH